MWRGATATCRYAAINYEDSICHASDSASPPCTTFSSPGLTGRRQRSAFLVRNPARCLRRYWNRWSWHPRRSVHLEKHSVADPVIDAHTGTGVCLQCPYFSQGDRMAKLTKAEQEVH